MRVAALVSALCLLSASPTPADTARDRIPTVQTTSLGGQQIDLPSALQGRLGILVLGFTRASREGVTSWGKRLAPDYSQSPSVTYYDLAMLADVPHLARGLVERTMRSSMPAPVQARFLVLTDHETTWRSLVQYTTPDDPYILLIDPHGQVLWRTHGPATDSAYAALQQQLQQHTAPPPPAR